MTLAGQNIRKLVKDGFVIRKPQKIHSRDRAHRSLEAKQKGRHSGYGECLYLLKLMKQNFHPLPRNTSALPLEETDNQHGAVSAH